MIEFEVRHTAEGVKHAYTEWWERRYRRAYRVSFGIAVFAFILMLLYASAPWPLVVMATGAAAYAALLAALRDTAVRLALQYLDILGPGPFRYVVSDTGLSESTAVGHCELGWQVFDSVVRQSNALILVRKPSEAQTFIVLPLSQIPPTVPSIVEAHIRSSQNPQPPARSL